MPLLLPTGETDGDPLTALYSKIPKLRIPTPSVNCALK